MSNEECIEVIRDTAKNLGFEHDELLQTVFLSNFMFTVADPDDDDGRLAYTFYASDGELDTEQWELIAATVLAAAIRQHPDGLEKGLENICSKAILIGPPRRLAQK